MFITLYYRTGFLDYSGNSIYVPLRNVSTPTNTTICKIYTSRTEANMAEVNGIAESPEDSHFRKTSFYVLIYIVVTGLTVRFNAVMNLSENLDLMWKYLTMCESELEKKAKMLAHQCPSDHNDEDLAEKCNIYQLYAKPIF